MPEVSRVGFAVQSGRNLQRAFVQISSLRGCVPVEFLEPQSEQGKVARILHTVPVGNRLCGQLVVDWMAHRGIG